MIKFSRKTSEQTPVDELRNSFNYLRAINPKEAEALLEALRCTAGAKEGDYYCPTEFSGESAKNFKDRVEVLIRATERRNGDRIATLIPSSN